MIIAVSIFFKSIAFTQPPSETTMAYIQALAKNYMPPLGIIKLLIISALGVLLIIASKKMESPQKLSTWSLCSLIVGLIIIFELHGGGVFGGMVAGILSTVGGGIGLYESQKNHK